MVTGVDGPHGWHEAVEAVCGFGQNWRLHFDIINIISELSNAMLERDHSGLLCFLEIILVSLRFWICRTYISSVEPLNCFSPIEFRLLFFLRTSPLRLLTIFIIRDMAFIGSAFPPLLLDLLATRLY